MAPPPQESATHPTMGRRQGMEGQGAEDRTGVAVFWHISVGRGGGGGGGGGGGYAVQCFMCGGQIIE